jgi:pilus assembly protein Flp/PilA
MDLVRVSGALERSGLRSSPGFRGDAPTGFEHPLQPRKTNMNKTHRRLRGRQAGQGMTEYIIIVALIAIAAIGAVTFFGGTVRGQVAGMAKELSGQDAAQMINRAKNQAGKAEAQANKNKGLSSYNDNQP